MPVSGWSVEHCSGTAQELHDRRLDEVNGPAIWVNAPVRRALVLGASQTPDLVDTARAEALGIEVSRRRSGGGIVLVDPATSVWIDVVVPIGGQGPTSEPAPLFRWIGDAWLSALRRLGIGGLSMHEGRLTDRDRTRLLCFAGLGPGEVVQQTPDGPRKVVGLSQRRTRRAARVQGLFVTDWGPDVLRHVVRPAVWPAGFDPTGVPTADAVCATVVLGMDLVAIDAEEHRCPTRRQVLPAASTRWWRRWRR